MSTNTETQPKWQQLFDVVVHVGFLGIAAVVSALYVLEGLAWITTTLPLKVLIVAAWCPFCWGQYWTHKRTSARLVSWFFLGVAFAVTVLVIMGTFVAMIHGARAS